MSRRRPKAQPRRRTADDVTTLALLGESVHLLRTTSLGTWLVYCIGTIPFVIALLYFVTEMSSSAIAYRRCTPESLLLALLFCWMKVLQSRFSRCLTDQRANVSPSLFGFRRWFLEAANQAFLHVFVVAAAAILSLLLVTLPAVPLVLCLGQQVTVAGFSGRPAVNRVIRDAWGTFLSRVRQNVAISAVFVLLYLVVFVNLFALAKGMPYLVKSLLGIQSLLVSDGLGLINTTTAACALGLTYLLVDPFVKATFALQHFYTAARHTGTDLLSALARLSKPGAIGILIFGLCILASTTTVAHQAPVSGAPPDAFQTVGVPDTAELDKAIDDVISQPEYAWRLPRDRAIEEDHESGFWKQVRTWTAELCRWLWVHLRDAWYRIREWFRRFLPERASLGGGLLSRLGDVRLIMWIALAVTVAAGLLVLVLHIRRRRKNTEALVEAVILPASPDLNRNDVSATDLPEDEWLRLAGDMFTSGDRRLGLRALFLASLASLARQDLVAIARFKSDRDYERELARRAHALPDLVSAFTDNIAMFECSWYGFHEFTDEQLACFRGNLDVVRGTTSAGLRGERIAAL